MPDEPPDFDEEIEARKMGGVVARETCGGWNRSKRSQFIG